MGSAFPALRHHIAGKWLALLLLAAANSGLILAVAGGFTLLSDIVAPLTGHLIGIGLAASAALLIRRGGLALLAGGLAATIVLHASLSLARCCQLPPAADGDLTRIANRSLADTGLTVLSLNTWHAHREPDRIARYLQASGADVVVLSEFGPPKRMLLAQLKTAYPYQVDCADWTCSLALISRVPFEASGAVRYSGRKPAFVWARLPGSLTVIGTHLYRPSRNPWLHAQQARELSELIRHIDGPIVVAGDLNTSPWSNAFRALRAATGLTPASILLPSWPAWPIALPQVALDHILVSSDIAVTAAGAGPAVGSDHLPVWAQVQFKSLMPERSRPPRRTVASRLAAASPHLGGQLLADFGGEHGGAGNLRR